MHATGTFDCKIIFVNCFRISQVNTFLWDRFQHTLVNNLGGWLWEQTYSYQQSQCIPHNSLKSILVCYLTVSSEEQFQPILACKLIVFLKEQSSKMYENWHRHTHTQKTWLPFLSLVLPFQYSREVRVFHKNQTQPWFVRITVNSCHNCHIHAHQVQRQSLCTHLFLSPLNSVFCLGISSTIVSQSQTHINEAGIDVVRAVHTSYGLKTDSCRFIWKWQEKNVYNI